MKQYHLWLILAILILTACAPAEPLTLVPLPTVTPTNEIDARVAEWITVYFTDPEGPGAKKYRGGPDKALAAAIDEARFSVEAAFYQLDLWSMRNALIAAHNRGVSVRLVTESDNFDTAEVTELIAAGITVISDNRGSLMHNKFVVIDSHEVWTGSMNLTTNGAYKNDNNLIRIRSSRLAENYLVEFEEMFTNELFGDYIVTNTPYSTMSVENVPIETYFSPDDGTAAHIVELIREAEESICFLAFSFTSDEIASALIEQAQQGVTITGVFEESQYKSNQGTEFDHLLDAGLDVRLDDNPNNMHHKLIIIDSEVVVTGSYNFSRSAEESNDENTLVIHNTSVAGQYLEEFERVFAMAQP
ncbi:MAG: phospholipase D-like domain-containing protein [Chloroflexota bacterium]|nr:phospholipase D-like domain-containing protein [Chloroflexota bacterium]